MTAGKRDRWLALGLLLGVLALAYAVLVHPWWTIPMRDLDARIDTLQQRELRLRAQLEQADEVNRQLAELGARQAERPGFMPEANAELATAALVQRLEAVVSEASPGNRSCGIVNRSPLEPSSREPYTRVTVQVRLKCGTPETAAVLHALESGSPRLFIGNLNILVQRMYFAPGSGRASSDGGLDVSFDLYGYLPPSGAEARDAT
ncbi:type II secretion system protein GspM [Marilutibacter alkalisoli]|uniref:General secretion pathway protein GspM n=1 Tax=Marilutibacter alkalisoli TaxID=2591633 RepID=A0A514BUE6_9GAMM|nr:type II secretion system protein GspM [Lysobacter alkalisoli]QDH70986.1 general secretion pathway protein GspM [Lysobacter alkalisoli]